MQIIRLNSSLYDANAYLVDKTTLVDVGMDADFIIEQLRKYIRPGDLKTVVLTHCHHDHTAGAGEVARAFGARIAIHEADALLLSDPRASVSDLFGEEAPSITPDMLLTGGESFGGLEVIHTPGHTPGSICLYDAGTKALFSGDTVFADGGFGRTDLYGGNTEQLISSIKKLTLLDIEAMYPGHGEMVKKDAASHIRMSLTMAYQFSGY